MLGSLFSHWLERRARRPRRGSNQALRPLGRRNSRLEQLEARLVLAADPIVTVNTTLGSFQIELFPNVAPQTVANFLSYVNSGSYTDTIFHRSVPGFVEQTG